MTSGQETERVYSYNPGAHTGLCHQQCQHNEGKRDTQYRQIHKWRASTSLTDHISTAVQC